MKDNRVKGDRVSEICLIAPTKELKENSMRVALDMGLDLDIFIDSVKNAPNLAEELIERGAQIIVSRRGFKQRIERKLDIQVVGIEMLLSDYIPMFEKLKDIGGLIAFFCFEGVPEFIETTSYLMGLNARFYVFDSEESGLRVVREAIKDGALVGVGGAVTEYYAKSHRLNYILEENAENTIKAALETAVQMLKLKKDAEKSKRDMAIRLERYNLILDHTHDGVVAINNKGIIEVMNPVAEKMIEHIKPPFVGMHIDEVIKNTKMVECLKSGRSEFDQVMNIDGTTILTNRIPIEVDGKISGVVATFKDVQSLRKSEQKLRIKLHEKGLAAKYNFDDIIGESDKINEMRNIGRAYANSDFTVLLTGESGTGKELFAQSIHNASIRKSGPFVAVNCAAIAKNLLEAELFGYEEGAFTGAVKGGKQGLFELAHGGTIFLDEIGELSMETQSQLLRVLQEKEVRRVGGDRLIPIDTRVIVATNRDLRKMVREGSFRIDLYYRLNVLYIEIPPLRDRREDILLIAEKHLVATVPKKSKSWMPVLENLLKSLSDYDWPGNIRELQNKIERFSVLMQENADIEHIRRAFSSRVFNIGEYSGGDGDFSTSFYMENAEKLDIIKALKKNSYNLSKTANDLNMSRSTLYRKMDKYNIKK